MILRLFVLFKITLLLILNKRLVLHLALELRSILFFDLWSCLLCDILFHSLLFDLLFLILYFGKEFFNDFTSFFSHCAFNIVFWKLWCIGWHIIWYLCFFYFILLHVSTIFFRIRSIFMLLFFVLFIVRIRMLFDKTDWRRWFFIPLRWSLFLWFVNMARGNRYIQARMKLQLIFFLCLFWLLVDHVQGFCVLVLRRFYALPRFRRFWLLRARVTLFWVLTRFGISSLDALGCFIDRCGTGIGDGLSGIGDRLLHLNLFKIDGSQIGNVIWISLFKFRVTLSLFGCRFAWRAILGTSWCLVFGPLAWDLLLRGLLRAHARKNLIKYVNIF